MQFQAEFFNRIGHKPTVNNYPLTSSSLHEAGAQEILISGKINDPT
ncbi:MAG: hypothetical protein [Olavius algarvensis Gamma 3 endosymbiont]|nr:MAG: hypothetical protein [Olavius algarvensis Gamma 3 endosymbiont]